MNNKEVFSANLKYYMDASNEARQAFAEAIGVGYSTATDWINGKKYPRIDKIEKIATHYGIKISDLIEKKPADNDGLSDKHKALIDFAKSVPEDQIDYILRVMKTILEAD